MHRQETTSKNTAKQKQTKKKKLLSYPDVNRWHTNLTRRSKNTAEVRLRRVGKFCEEHSMTPMELIDIGLKGDKTIADLLQDHITAMEERGNAPQYIKTTMTAVKSWLNHFDIGIRRKLLISNVTSTPTLTNEKVPEADELVDIFTGASLRAGTIMSFMAKIGLRPQVLGNIDGTDGLMLEDLADLALVDGKWCFLNQPPRVTVRNTLSKTNHEYFGFMTPLEQVWVLAYLNERMLQGETLNPKSPVVAPKTQSPQYREQKKGRFMSTQRVAHDVSDAMRPKFKQRPYVLRAYYRTQLLIAEAKGKVSHEYAEFWFGHTGDMSARYSTNKGILPEQLLESMKESFVKCQEFLDLEKQKWITKDEPKEKQEDNIKDKISKLSEKELSEVSELLSDIIDELRDGKTQQSQKRSEQNSG